MNTSLLRARRSGTEPPPDGADDPRGIPPVVSRWYRRPRRFLSAVLVVSVVAGVAGVVPALLADRDRARDGAVLAAASSTVADLVGVDSGTVQGAYDRLRAGATGEWGEQLAGQADSFSRAVRDAGVTSRGDITGAAIEHADGATATALVTAAATVRNRQAPDGEARSYRIAMDVVRADERWLVTKLDFVP